MLTTTSDHIFWSPKQIIIFLLEHFTGATTTSTATADVDIKLKWNTDQELNKSINSVRILLQLHFRSMQLTNKRDVVVLLLSSFLFRHIHIHAILNEVHNWTLDAQNSQINNKTKQKIKQTFFICSSFARRNSKNLLSMHRWAKQFIFCVSLLFLCSSCTSSMWFWFEYNSWQINQLA